MTSEGMENKRADEERDLAVHNENLFDQDEDASGEKMNLATGEVFDNSTSTGFEELQTVTPDENSTDALGALPEEDDEAARWLREHPSN